MKVTEEEEIKRLVEITPPLPEDFKPWCEKQMKRPLIYYRRKGKEAEIKCAACGKTLYAKTADMPEHWRSRHRKKTIRRSAFIEETSHSMSGCM